MRPSLRVTVTPSVTLRQKTKVRTLLALSSASLIVTSAFFFLAPAGTISKKGQKSQPDHQLCPGEQIQLECFEGDFYEWTPAEGLNNTHIKNPVAKPIKSTTYKANVYKLLTPIVSIKHSDSIISGQFLARQFQTTMNDSYHVSMRADVLDPLFDGIIQMKINYLPVMRVNARSGMETV